MDRHREGSSLGIRTAVTVAGAEIRLLMRTGALWKLTGIHCALLVAALLLVWPTPERLVSASPPLTFKWLLLTEAVALGYVTLALSSDSLRWGETERLRPPHWVAYGDASPWAVLAGRIAALWYVYIYLVLTALPVFILAHGVSPIPAGTTAAWAAAALAVLTLLGVIGLLIGSRFHERSTRMIAVDTVCLLIVVALIILGNRGTEPSEGLYFYLNPARVLEYALDPPQATAGARRAAALSWPLWWALQGGLLLFGVSVTAVQLQRWVRREPPPPVRGRPIPEREKGKR